MEKNKNILGHINNKRVIDQFINKPKRWIKYEDLKGPLRQLTGETEIRDALRMLSKKGLLVEKRQDSREKIYAISTTRKAFREILDGYYTDDIDTLLRSDYINYLIEKRGFRKICEAFKLKLDNPKFRQAASISLLNYPATKVEIQESAIKFQSIISDPSFHKKDGQLSPDLVDYIKILGILEPLFAVRFYREFIHESIRQAFNILNEKSFISTGLRDFLVLDSYLSPLNSYPVNSIEKLLYSQPFQRIYEDAYLLGGELFWVLSARAYAIYNNFADILFELFKYNQNNEKERETITKYMMFYWNVASTRFDRICFHLDYFHTKARKSGNYHLKNNGLEFNIIDLENNKPLLPQNLAEEILKDDSVPNIFEESKLCTQGIMENAFELIRPCTSFKYMDTNGMKWRFECISFEEVFSDLELRLAEYNGRTEGALRAN